MNINESTGNDVVALKAIDKDRSGNPKFYSKILSVSEQMLYYHGGIGGMPFENFLWLLWSVKESTYKYVQRNLPDLVFSPSKIVVQRIDFPSRPVFAAFGGLQWEAGNGFPEDLCGEDLYGGSVLFGSRVFYFRSKVDVEFISTVVHETDNFENIGWGVKRIGHPGYDRQSEEVRAFVLNRLGLLLRGDDLRGDHLGIGKDGAGCPVVLKGGEETGIPVSFAHHDHFIAYSFLLRN